VRWGCYITVSCSESRHTYLLYINSLEIFAADERTVQLKKVRNVMTGGESRESRLVGITSPAAEMQGFIYFHATVVDPWVWDIEVWVRCAIHFKAPIN
jgi:hypothetical protein